MGSVAAAVNGLLKRALALVFIAFTLNAGAQVPYVIAGSVSVSGNRITHRNIILRELKFSEIKKGQPIRAPLFIDEIVDFEIISSVC